MKRLYDILNLYVNLLNSLLFFFDALSFSFMNLKYSIYKYMKGRILKTDFLFK